MSGPDGDFRRAFLIPRLQADAERIERAQNEAEFGATVPTFNADDPLAAHANLLGKRSLTETELLAAISNDRAKISGGTNKHGNTLSTFDDSYQCQRSTTRTKCLHSATYYCAKSRLRLLGVDECAGIGGREHDR